MNAKNGLLIYLIAMAIGNVGGQAAGQQPGRPNILMIAVDDLNDFTTPLGGAQDVLKDPALRAQLAPNLARLAQRGVTFTNAQTSHPTCNASRAALMAGISGDTSGLTSNAAALNWRNFDPVRWVTTLPQHLKTSRGYNIQTTGKVWHEAGQSDSPTATAGSTPASSTRAVTNWDAVVANGNLNVPTHRTEANPWPLGTNANTQLSWKKMIPTTGGVDDTSPAKLQALTNSLADQRAAAWAATQVANDVSGGTSRFISTGIFRPHLPWEVPVHFFDRFPLDKITIPNVIAGDRSDLTPPGSSMGILANHPEVVAATPGSDLAWRSAIQAYLASVAYADEAIGKMLTAVEAKNQDADANNDWTIVLWSDHGYHVGEKELWQKFTLWEESTRSNLMIWAPNVSAGGVRIDTPVDFLDVAPTIFELAGAPTLPQLQGESLLPLVSDPSSRRDSVAFTSFGEPELGDGFYSQKYAVRSSRFRYIYYQNDTEELYDHEHDPNEFYNLLHATNAVKLAEFGLDAAQRDAIRRWHGSLLLRHLIKTNAKDATGAGPVSLEGIETAGDRHLQRFATAGDLAAQNWTLQQAGADFVAASGRVKAPANISAISTLNAATFTPTNDFLAAVDVRLEGGATGAGLVFGYKDADNWYEWQLIDEATPLGAGGVDARLVCKSAGVEQVLVTVTDIKQLDAPAGPALDFSQGDYKLLVEYSAAEQDLELIVQDGLGINVHRSHVALASPLPGGGLFGIATAAGAGQKSFDNFFVIVDPGSPLAGDYNNDGQVSAADYTSWRDTLNQQVPVGTGADGDRDGRVDQDDLAVWRSAFASSVPAAALLEVVPEPSSAMLSLICTGLGLAYCVNAAQGSNPAQATLDSGPENERVLRKVLRFFAIIVRGG